jgi:hypothetical protein
VRDADQAPKHADPTGSSQPPRASQPPHAPRPWKGAWRLAFALVWVTTQIALVITADRRPDGAFGFRMFSESSTLEIALYREVTGDDGQLARVHVDDGVWSAHDGSGASHRHAWNERVRRQELATFDVEMNAKYGVDAQLARLQAALDDLATHVPDDVDTRRFLLDVTVRKNAREPYVAHLASAERGRLTSGGP